MALLLGPPLHAASTGTAALVTPQGNGSTTANGEYVSSGAGLNTSYRYFIEVTPGLPRLVVDLFDADLGAGGTGEAAAGRDRQRGGAWNTAVGYSLIDPNGAARTTRFATGSDTAPTGGDNAWLTLYNGTGRNVRDNFTTSAYTNNDGTNNWSAAWAETDGGGGGATGGSIQVTGGELRLQDVHAGQQSILRQADLSPSGLSLGVAYFSFDFRTSSNLESADQVQAQVRICCGAWTTLETFSGVVSGSRTFDITAFIANNTQVRFLVADGEFDGNSGAEFFFVDNVQIHDGGALTAGHWELRVDMSSAVTAGDDIHALGIRAHDGNSAAGGTEVNVYYDSQSSFGVNPPTTGTNTRSYTYHPYLTSGCSASKNDFDYDSNSGVTGSMSFTSRGGGFLQSYTSASLSGDNVWRRDTFSGWTSDQSATDYGIWTTAATIISYVLGGTQNGNYAHLWVGNFQAAANPPAANPTANAFRVYLPTDGAGTPTKPYLEQLLTFRSGLNPTVVGQTSRFQVTVRLVNPTAHAITFSASNLVTANVPGGGAVYAGNAAVGQGSILSQPALGGTGNVTWNPGTVAAGATTVLTYQVDVTPTSVGQRIPVTATPASGNGTRAQYVDETGNTTQARATHLFGPLCELATTQGLLTPAVVSSFGALPARQGGLVVAWQTAAELGTIGFRLRRRDPASGRFRPVHDGVIAALAGADQGGTYRFHDGGAWPGEAHQYQLEEITAGGPGRRFGPYRVDPRTASELAPELEGELARLPHPTRASAAAGESPPLGALDAAPGSTPSRSATASTAPTESLRVAVSRPGLVQLGREQLVAALGLPASQVEQRLDKGKLVLSRDGRQVPWYLERTPDGKPAALLFYAELPESLYTRNAVYRLDLKGASGTAMEVTATTGGSGNGHVGAFTRAERDVFPATALPLDPESDYWFWEFLQGGHPSFGNRAFALTAPGAAASEPAELTVDLQGATASGVAGEHQVAVLLNDTALGSVTWTGIAAARGRFPVPSGTLLAGDNTVRLVATVGGGAPYSISYLDGIELAYRRTPTAAGDQLLFTTGGPVPITISGLGGGGAALLDVTDPARPRWVQGAAQASGQLGFVPGAGPRRYLVAGPSARVTPGGGAVSLRPWKQLRRAGAQYLVLAPPALLAPAQRLVDLRQRQGLAGRAVDVEAIGDSFGSGVLTPQAIRGFLADAYAASGRRLRFVTLAGEGSVDYRDLLGFGEGLIPPLMARTASGLFPADARYGDVDGDGLPELTVGRLPVLSSGELAALVDKVVVYEAVPAPPWGAAVLLLSDAPDQATAFGQDHERLGSQLASTHQLERIDLATTPLAQARARLFAAFGEGKTLVSYLGHGALDRLASAGLLTSSDVAGLVNGDRLPVLSTMTCTINRFAVPGVPALGELLVKRPNGGAAAVFGPSGLAVHAESRGLGETFYRLLEQGAGQRLGDLALRALLEHVARGGSPELFALYNLLGDSALRLAAPPARAPSGGSTGE